MIHLAINFWNRACNALHCGPTLIAIGLTIVVTAQLLPGVPIAGSIALIGWGSALTTAAKASRDARLPRLVMMVGVYAPLTALTAAAQFHLAFQKWSAAWQTLAAVDAAASVTLVCLLLRWTIDQFTQPEQVKR